MNYLLPLRHPQADLFICDVFDTFRDDQASMEHPAFSLSTRPDRRARKYEHNGNTLEVLPGFKGLATIHDKDVLLYLASHLVAEINRRQEEAIQKGLDSMEAPPQAVRFVAYDLLVATNRPTNNLGYKRLEAALDRLQGTVFKTNIRTNDRLITKSFGMIEWYEIIRRIPGDESSQMVGVEVKLSDWFYNSIIGLDVLSINRNYFRLRKPIERRLYELARKHCGASDRWEISLDLLLKKTGAGSTKKKFRELIKPLLSSNHLPDYRIELAANEKVIFRKRKNAEIKDIRPLVHLRTEDYERAKQAAPGYDVYYLEQEWRNWIDGKPRPDKPGAAFVGFCKSYADRRSTEQPYRS